MSVTLLDVNMLVALFDPSHPNHEHAHRWFGSNNKHGWSTCPITINGCIRVMGNPAYRSVDASPLEIAERLREFCNTSHHYFWPDSVSVLDETLFRWQMIAGHQQITDAYLLGLAVSHHGRLVTFDRSISLKTVRGATPGHLVVLGSK